MDALMQNRLRLIGRELSRAITEDQITEYSVKYTDPAYTKNKTQICLQVVIGTAETSKSLLLSFHTRDTWSYDVQHLIQEFVNETQGNVFLDAEDSTDA